MSNLELINLIDRVAIVTGSAHGIGKATSEALAWSGATVVVSDFDICSAKKVAANIEKAGGKAIALKCDVTIDADMVSLVDQTIKKFGRIDVLVNNVGGGAGQEDSSKITIDNFKRVYDLNVFSMWRLCQLVSPHMKKLGAGSIINMSSMASINTSPAISAYSSSKAAINHMTKNLAIDYGPEIRVNAVGPGAIKTDALSKVLTPKIEEKCLHIPRFVA